VTPAADGPVRLRLADVAYTYGGRTSTRALDGLTLEVRDNELVAVVGPVGCGKTTLVRIVAGFLEPTQGTVMCGGEPVKSPGPDRGYVFQQDAIFPWMTVRENVEFGLLARGERPASRREVSRELIGMIGLEAYERAYPRELSAGMSKMVEVARVLATSPSVLLMDEPFASLDAQTRARMQDELSALWAKRRTTIVFVTHDVEEAIVLADRIAVLSPRPGRVVADLAVDLPRPRTIETRLAPAFTALKRAVWAALGLAI
jgi:ABC-type nitrate/sulfonate/bicarbonate transport system ATPase subunit